MSEWTAIGPAIERAIESATGRMFRIDQRRAVAGGDINDAHVVSHGDRTFFVKINSEDRRAMFEAEAAGLTELRQSASLRVPEPVAVDTADEIAFIVLEYIDLRRPTREAMSALGEGLADLHGIVAARHGWGRDNTIGPNPQFNARHADWVEFWRENRLAVMLDALAPNYPEIGRAGDKLLAVLPDLLSRHRPEASLLHGDLWGGNAGMDAAGRPAIFDPAVYYGDRETDIALTELFGGFAPEFYEAYWGAWPTTPGYRQIRRPLYQLYHLLNHARLFGAGYACQAQRVMRELVARA